MTSGNSRQIVREQEMQYSKSETEQEDWACLRVASFGVTELPTTKQSLQPGLNTQKKNPAGLAQQYI